MTVLASSPQTLAAGSALGPDATRRAARSAIEALGGRAPGLLLAFASRDDAGDVAAGLSSIARGAIVAGMTGGGLVSTAGPLEQGCVALAFDQSVDAGLGIAERASEGLYEAGRRAAVAALAGIDASARHRVLLLFLDTASGDQALAVAGAYSAAGPAIPLAGGAAGGEASAQFAGGRAVHDSVVAVAIGSPRPIGMGIAHGCTRVAVPSIVTGSDERWLQELDGRPAETVYLEKLGLKGAHLSDSEFEALAACHPLAQPELSGQVRLRHVLARGERGSLRCATPLPPNSAVEFTVQEPEWIVRSAFEAVSAALAPLDRAPARAALVFDCAGRKRALGDSLSDEVAAIVASFGANPPRLAGLYTHGEIGRLRGAKGDRNHAIVVVAFG